MTKIDTMYIPIVTTNTIYTVIVQDLIFHGWQVGKDFLILFRGSLYGLYIKEKLDENFTCSKVTVKFTKLMFLENYCI